MTEREANVRVNVTGNAAQKLGEVAKATETAGNKANAANSRFQRSGQTIDAAANAAKRGASAAGQLAAANARADVAAKLASGSFQKLGGATVAASAKFKALANDAARTVGANQRAASAAAAHSAQLEKLTRSVAGANAALRQTPASSRIASQVPIWQRIATATREAARNAAAYASSLPGRSAGFGGQGGRVLAGAAALGGAAVDAARGAGATLGVSSRDQLAGEYATNDVRLARLSTQANMSDAEADSLRAQITSAARGGLMNPADIISIIETGQERFSDAAGFARAAPEIARFSTATGSDAQDVAGLIGEAQRQMGVNISDPNTLRALLGSVQVTGDKGSVGVGDIAGSMSPSIGAYASLTGESGLEGMSNFLALAQTMGASGGDAAMLTQNLLSKLSSADVQRNLERGGVNVRNEDGSFVGMQELVAQMAANPRFVGANGQINAGALQGVLGGDMQVNTAMRTLLQEQLAGRGLDTIANSSSAEGMDKVNTAMRRIEESAGGEAMKARSDAAANFMENGDAYVRSLAAAASAASQIDTTFPRASAAADLLRGSFETLTGTLGALNLAGVVGVGGAGVAAAGGAGSVAAAGGTGLAAAGGAASLATGGAGFLAGLYGGGELLDAGLRATGRQGLDDDEKGIAGIMTLIQQVMTNSETTTNGSTEDVRRRVMEQAQRRAEGGAAGGTDAANTQAIERNTRSNDRLSGSLDRLATSGGVGRTSDAGR